VEPSVLLASAHAPSDAVAALVGAIPYPDIDPVAFEIGPLAVRWYGLTYILGFALTALIVWDLIKRWDLPLTSSDVLDMVIAAAAGVLVGARLAHVVTHDVLSYLDEPLSILAVWDGGMAFHGGAIGLAVAGYFMARRLKVSFLTLSDMVVVGAPLALFFGRLANFVNGELWGRVTDAPWGMVFPGAGPDPRHPSQLYEGFLEGLVVFVLLFALSRKRRPEGVLTGLFLVLYGVFRAGAEFFREPYSLVLGPLTGPQLLSVPMIAIGVWLLWRAWRDRSETRSAEETG
jgi:phosphatidylglycerol:prolipoprotein diacylglycerol transferase